jgi:hypothetical protein
MAGDPRGDLGRAFSAAARAARLAQTPQERFEALLLLSRIDCDRGHHQEELAEARLLIRLAPHDLQSLGVLQRAAGCNGLKPLVAQTSAELKRIVDSREPPGAVAGYTRALAQNPGRQSKAALKVRILPLPVQQ